MRARTLNGVNVLRKVLGLFTERERRQAFLLIPVVIAMAFAEVVGIASIAPFLSLVADPDAARSDGVLGWFYQTFGFTSDRSFVIAVGAVVLVALIGSNALLALGNYALFKFGAMRNHSISRRLLIRYLQQPYAFFLERNSSGLANNILQEVLSVINSVVMPGLLGVAKAVGAIAILALLVALNPLLALAIGVLLGGAYALVYLFTRRQLAYMGKERVRANQARFKAATEAMGGIKDLKLMGREAESVARYSTPSRHFAIFEAKQQIILRLPRFALEAIALGGLIAIVLVLLVRGSGVAELLPLLGVYAFAGYRLLPALHDVFQGIGRIRYGTGSLNEVASMVHDIEAGISHSDAFVDRRGIEPLPLQHEFRMEGLSFRYSSSERPVLSEIDLAIPALASVAFVGPTGAGKTTIVDIILGLLEPDSGRLLVDGVPVSGENVIRWQKTLGYVPQDIFLTDDTVARNIALGVRDDEIDRDALVKAAQIAQIHAFIESDLDQGYETEVGERGIRLSGGQRQRLGIARALYHDPDVLVLDEATSALDGATERSLFEALQRLSGKKTMITIAHRLTTVRECDTIYVMEAGRIAASGTYDELLDSNPLFRTLASLHDGDDRVTATSTTGGR